MAAKSIRKSVSFDDSDGDRALLDAIATHQAEQQQTFSDLCKQALRQYLLSREPTQAVMLFMELQHQLAQLNVRVAALEGNKGNSNVPETLTQPETEVTPDAVVATPDMSAEPENDDPILNRLGPLLDDF
ncbi:MAG: hypothetical protein AAFY17_12060 [Cyanobacteria bacterium J06642_11]